MKKMLIPMFTIFLGFACLAGGIRAYVPERQLEASFAGIWGTFDLVSRLILISLALAAGLALLMALAWLSKLVRYSGIVWATNAENRRVELAIRQVELDRERAEAARAWRDASLLVTVAPINHQILLSEVAGGVGFNHKPAHLSPGIINGTAAEPSPWQIESWQHWQDNHATRKPARLPAPVDDPPALLDSGPVAQGGLLDLLTLEQRLLLLGPSGSGKSSLLRRVVAGKLPVVDQVLLCDLHGSRPKWGAGVDAVGFGEDFESILDTFERLEWLHRQRIQEVARGAPERSFPVILCVIEEVQALAEFCKQQKVDLGHYIRMFLTRTRKTAIDVIVVTQSDTVKALGLEGFGKNRDAFAYARTMGRQGRGHRVEYENEFGERSVFDAPPLWPDTRPVGVVPQKVLRLNPAPTSEQYKIIDVLLADPEASDYQISMAVWGKKGSSYKAKIEEVRRMFGSFLDGAEMVPEWC